MLAKLLLAFLLTVNIILDYGESSYTGISHYHHKIKRMASFKSSYISRWGVPPIPRTISSSSAPVSTGSRVYHAIDYGADPTGNFDSIDALEQAIFDAFGSLVEGHLIHGMADLGGAELHLDGGTYKISRPLCLPRIRAGNFMIHGGSLVASNAFPTDRHMVELLPFSKSFSYEYITLKDLMIDSNFKGGGIAILNSVRTTIDNCYITHFMTNGIFIEGGHETYVRNTYIGQYITAGGDRREKDFSGIGINIIGNDNAVTDVVIFSAWIGIKIRGQANMVNGVHCYNKATGLGGIGIYIQASGLTQNRIANSYLDFTGIVAEDPVQLHVTGTFFLGNAFILLKSLKGVLSGINIVDNMFSGDYTGIPIVQLDESNAPFKTIDQVIVDKNEVNGMVLKSTAARGYVWGNGTTWTVDFSKVLLFPNMIKHVQYTLQAGSSFASHILRNVSENRVTVESESPIPATLHVSVDQTMVTYT
ncbi:Pectin lyase/virulence factor [Corchorus olitorius]|uniref:Pectin lyase/virulence factor n=1 Tax=Corchorus olitorius TaxID=93759 RepID=A0A1R3KJL9_9ROSI|nr:Pectin lyase/virulence factor [Corchorus olitorius]